jgi:hypothetical protein
MTQINVPFDELISLSEIEQLRALYHDMRTHPLVAVALHPGAGQSPDQISINTCQALRLVLDTFPDWARNLKRRLIDAKDWTNAESALAEIRACGALLEAGLPVQLGGKNAATGAKAEFHVTLDGVETIIEVWTRNLSNKDIQRMSNELAEFATTRATNGGRITTAVSTNAPFGAPDPNKQGDSILTNVISRVASIKEREHQAHDRRAFIVWADLQSHNTMRFDFSHDLQPLKSWNGLVSSGGYWHALYGRKGDHLLEEDAGLQRSNMMQHDGRYYQTMEHGEKTRISAFIFSSSETTALMENPAAVNPLREALRSQFIGLPWFDISQSLANWSEGLVERTIEVQRATIKAVAESLGLATAAHASCLSKARAMVRRCKVTIVRRLSAAEDR